MKINAEFSTINDFYKILNKNAPLYNDSNNAKIKYPYKSFLMLSLINTYKESIFSNIKLNLDNEKFLKSFYDFMTNDYELFKILSKQKSKTGWGLGFTNKNKKNILKLIKEMPLKKIQSKYVTILENNFVLLNFNISADKQSEALEYLKKLCYINLKKCIPWYENKNDLEIEEYKETILSQFFINGDEQNDFKRSLQHIFRKEVLDRDGKCLICCIDNYIVLEACHIKPYAVCDNDEKYDLNNGLTLCRNHHKLFDSGSFAFSENLKILISRHFDSDEDLYFRQYENCWNLINKKLNIEKYRQHHYMHIFEKN
ncbi:MAG: HNH endonuclease signature motif containing protein [Malacoplasma sp.]